VWASGDGGPDDDCNCDGYAASMWTISINSATNDGQTASYDESCSSTLASTFSNGKSWFMDAGVVSDTIDSSESIILIEKSLNRNCDQAIIWKSILHSQVSGYGVAFSSGRLYFFS
jgi:hypothetical protein